MPEMFGRLKGRLVDLLSGGNVPVEDYPDPNEEEYPEGDYVKYEREDHSYYNRDARYQAPRETAREPRETREKDRRGRDPHRDWEHEDVDYVDDRKPSRSSNIVEFKNNYTETQMSVILTHPSDIQEAMYISDYIKGNKACIVNLTDVERAKAQRIADFLGGAAYAVGGEIQRISNDIFMVAPASVHISDDMKNELATAGFEFKKVSSFR